MREADVPFGPSEVEEKDGVVDGRISGIFIFKAPAC